MQQRPNWVGAVPGRAATVLLAAYAASGPVTPLPLLPGAPTRPGPPPSPLQSRWRGRAPGGPGYLVSSSRVRPNASLGPDGSVFYREDEGHFVLVPVQPEGRTVPALPVPGDNVRPYLGAQVAIL